MHRFFLMIALLFGLSACAQGETESGLLGGAVLGAALDDDNPARGAVIGATLGGVAGAVVERYNDGTCLYRNPETGGTYRGECPS